MVERTFGFSAHKEVMGKNGRLFYERQSVRVVILFIKAKKIRAAKLKNGIGLHPIGQ